MKKQNLSDVGNRQPEGMGEIQIGIVTSSWNEQVTGSLRDAAMEHLLQAGLKESQIHEILVPGAYELPLGAKLLADKSTIDAILCLGCVIQGETRHFDFIAQSCSDGIMRVGLETGKPIIFGVLTTNTMEQALARSGGAHGNKGIEAASTALEMLKIKEEINLFR